MVIKGKVHKFGNDVNTDDIISARYLNIIDPKELGSHCMEILAHDFSKKVSAGDIIVAGNNFGCGSTREHAPISIKGCGVSLVVAKSFARIFYRNSINIGLPIIELEDAEDIVAGDELEVNLISGQIKNAQLEKVPWMIVIGQKEVDANTVSIRHNDGKQEFGLTLEQLIAKAHELNQ